MSDVICPCCSSTLLRHIRHAGVYWYCSRCHEEMPDLSLNSTEQDKHKQTAPLSSVKESPNFKFNYIHLQERQTLRTLKNSVHPPTLNVDFSAKQFDLSNVIDIVETILNTT